MAARLTRIWHEWRAFFLFVVVMLVFRSAVADWNQVPSGSMLPSILVGDRIVVDKLAYDLRVPFTHIRLARWQAPERGDVVTFTSPEDERLLVKRIVAVPGDEVSLRSNRLTINGVEADYERLTSGEAAAFSLQDGYAVYRESIFGSERTILLRTHGGGFTSSFPTVRVPEGHYLMLGDNRENSRDSRVIGFINRNLILGHARVVAFSLDYENFYAPRMGRFFTELP